MGATINGQYYTDDELKDSGYREEDEPYDEYTARGHRDEYPGVVRDANLRTDTQRTADDARTSSSGSSREDALRRVQDAYNRAGVELDQSDINRFNDPTLKHDEDVPGFADALMVQLGLRAASNAPRGTPSRPALPQYSGGGNSGGGDSALSSFMSYLQQQQQRQDAERAQMRQILMSQLGEAQKPISESDPGIREVLAGGRLANQRGAERARAELAERLAADDQLGGGGVFRTGVDRILQQQGEYDTQFTGNVMQQEMVQRRNHLQQLLQLAVASGDAESARTLQAQLASINSQLQNQQFNAQLDFNYDALGQQGALGMAGLNQSALLALLGAI